MTSQLRQDVHANPNQTDNAARPATSAKWAPWWIYVVIIVGANYLRRAVAVDGGGPAMRVIIALAVSAVLFVAITVVYRAIVRRGGSHS
jgi:hypothetical protein